MPKIKGLPISKAVVHPPQGPFIKASEIGNIPINYAGAAPSVKQKMWFGPHAQDSIIKMKIGGDYTLKFIATLQGLLRDKLS
jgi:hypothetical protein